MPLINVLPEEVRNYISCGEVIESPSSVVKELVENSIDSGAGRIDVRALEAGLDFISVTDDGSGMDSADLQLSLQPFATSKIRSKNDIASVQSMGFRGEALASIANVSSIKIFSSSGQGGSMILSEGGREIDRRPFACPKGTSVEVRKLFFNAPVRKRFLKSPKYMNGEILRVVREYALARPDIVFSLSLDDKNFFDGLSSSDDEKERVRKIFGFANADCISTENPLMGMSCFSYPEDYKSSRRWQFVFINRRPISSAAILKAAENAFEGYLPRGKHPPLFIYVTASSGLIDVNVHPAKREIRFQSPRAFYQMVYDALRKKYSSEKSAFYFPTGDSSSSSGVTQNLETSGGGISLFPDSSSAPPAPAGDAKEQGSSPDIRPDGPSGRQASAPVRWESFRYVGKSHGKFLIFSTFDAIHIIDFHAAAERVNYEKTKKLIREGSVASQKLLVPIEVKLSTDEIESLRAEEGLLIKLGLSLSYSSACVSVAALPAGFKGSEKDMLTKISSALLDGKKHNDVLDSVVDRAVKIIACHMSFRVGDDLKPSDAEALINELKKCEEPLRCPHGRPVMFSIPVSKMDSILGR